jgi:hypothetical protein
MSLLAVTCVTDAELACQHTILGFFLMPDTRELLQVLKAELAFLENGGYHAGARYPWRPNFVFQDSPTCINFKNQTRPKPCSECLLMSFVPENHQSTRYPCRHIPLTTLGETVSAFYEWGTEQELEAALRSWLVAAIQDLERAGESKGQSA